MTSVSPRLLDDNELIQVATAPRTRLFPVLNRAAAFAPLIMVCCVLPAIELLAKPVLNEEGALWALRALSVANATTLMEIIEPGLNEPGQPLIFQPPLSAWLNGAVISVAGPTHFLSNTLVSLSSAAVSIWLITRLAWRIGGANTALVSAILMCCHPQTLDVAISPGNGSTSLCLTLACVFGIQRHLEGKWARISPSLVISGIVWGFLVLSIGPFALIIPLLFALHALNQRNANPLETAQASASRLLHESKPVVRAIVLMMGIGFIISGWWGFVIGRAGFQSWWTGLPIDCFEAGKNGWRSDLRPLLQPNWRDWLEQQSLIIPWLVVGLERSWHIVRHPPSEFVRRRHQLLMLWWLIAFIGLCLAETAAAASVVNTKVWYLMLLGPTVLLSSLGIGALIERAVSRRGEFFLLVLLASLTMARLSYSWLVGMTAGALLAMLIIMGPRLFLSSGRTEHGWSQSGWRQLLQCIVYGSLIACFYLGYGERAIVVDDELRLADLRDRFRSLPDVQRISMITSEESVPQTLRYLLRCRWPDAKLISTEDWDVGLTGTMSAESGSPHSRFLILEWTHRDVRILANTGQEWITRAAGDPMRFHGRRLSMFLIEPRS